MAVAVADKRVQEMLDGLDGVVGTLSMRMLCGVDGKSRRFWESRHSRWAAGSFVAHPSLIRGFYNKVAASNRHGEHYAALPVWLATQPAPVYEPDTPKVVGEGVIVSHMRGMMWETAPVTKELRAVNFFDPMRRADITSWPKAFQRVWEDTPDRVPVYALYGKQDPDEDNCTELVESWIRSLNSLGGWRRVRRERKEITFLKTYWSDKGKKKARRLSNLVRAG